MAMIRCMGCMEENKDNLTTCPYCGYEKNTPAKEAYHMEPGSILFGRYIVGKVIGYGGFGVTYIGYDGLLDKKIAIKEYLPSEFATRMPGQTEVTVYSGEREEQFYSGIDKFVEEAKRLAQLKEVPGIVRIYDSFTENKTAYIIMEYLEGETLKSCLNREGKLGIDKALDIIMPVLTALQEVHKLGIIHRDIAPDNIFITSNGEVKLLDFGAARYATTTHSKSLSVIIKQGYAPEEQYRSKGDQGAWTDVYACGATLYKMLTGITPEDSMERAGKDTLQPPSKKGAKTSKNLDTAIMNAMNIRIEDRTQSAEEFKEELLSVSEVKRKKVHDRKMDIGKWPLWVKIVSGAAACGIVTFGALLATGVIHFDMQHSADNGLLASNEVYVPNVVNYGVTEAETKILESSLILQIVDKQNSDMIPKDKILSQNLEDGTVVEAGTALEVIVSAGGEIVYLQDLSGMELEEAKMLLDSLGIYYEIQEEESEIAPGYVIAQDVDENTGIEKGTTVVLTVSTGNSKYDETVLTTVPELVDKNWDSAREAIKDAKLYIYKISTEYSDTIPKGQVISQDIASGANVTQGTKVGVVVSLGIEMVRVPDVQFKDKDSAATLLSNNNLTYEFQYEDSDTIAKDHIIRQSIPAGDEVVPQTKVILYVSNGNANVNRIDTNVANNNTTISQIGMSAIQSTSDETATSTTRQNLNTKSIFGKDLKGMTEAEARKTLQDLGITVDVMYRSYEGKTYNEGEVIGLYGAYEEDDLVSLVTFHPGCKITLYVANNATQTEYRYAISNAVDRTICYSMDEYNDYLQWGWNFVGYEYEEWSSWNETWGGEYNDQYFSDPDYEYEVEVITSAHYRWRSRKKNCIFERPNFDFAEWSEWSTTPATESPNCKVETRQVYVYENLWPAEDLSGTIINTEE